MAGFEDKKRSFKQQFRQQPQAKQQYKPPQAVGKTGENQSGCYVYRSEWRVTSLTKPPRVESFDLRFLPSQIVPLEMTDKLAYAEKQLKENKLRYGERLYLKSIVYIGRSDKR